MIVLPLISTAGISAAVQHCEVKCLYELKELTCISYDKFEGHTFGSAFRGLHEILLRQ